MKPVAKTKSVLQLMVLATALMMNVGCAKETGGDAGAPAPVPCDRGGCGTGVVPPPPGSPPTSYYSGATAALTGVTNSTLGQMFYNSKPNSPTQHQINFDANRDADNVVISYVDGGKVIEAGLGVTYPGGSRTDKRYNGWVLQGSTPVYKGFFQDGYGAVVLIIDKTINLGDGTPAPFVGGSVWFQNFGDNPTFDSPYQGNNNKLCWEITYGPYDCRTFVTETHDWENAVNMVLALTPTAPLGQPYQTRTKAYKKLGDFVGLSRAAAGL